MFNRLSRELKNLEQIREISVDLPLDEDGYLDRQCPSESCKTSFKVLEDDWNNKIKNAQVFCPICGFDAPSDEWHTPEQVEYAKELVIAQVKKNIHSALEEDSKKFNRNQRPGFIQISMSFEPECAPTILPLDAANAMRQKFLCELCACHYASIGAAFFCPACGHNSAVSMFDQSVTAIRQAVLQIDSIRNTFALSCGQDIAEDSVRNFLEFSLVHLVGAFQHFSEALFDNVQNASKKRRKNAFQNLSESSKLWRDAIGSGYEIMLLPDELQAIESLFQKRHLLSHRNGIVDQEYIDKSYDKTFKIGQRLVVKDVDVLRLADLLSKLAIELRNLTNHSNKMSGT